MSSRRNTRTAIALTTTVKASKMPVASGAAFGPSPRAITSTRDMTCGIAYPILRARRLANSSVAGSDEF